MARKPAVLVTGANGEIGHGLIHRLADLGTFDILALDVRPLEIDLARRCGKLYCEHLGRYYARHYRQLAAQSQPAGVDFRSIRFPGLISAFTTPSGGTSDYAPEMLHAASRRRPYACFVREDTRIPFMVMPDAIGALLDLLAAPAAALTSTVYNVSAFSPTAGELADLVREAFPGVKITFEPDRRRQAF